MIIDVHAHLSWTKTEQDKKNIRRYIEKYNINKVYISAVELTMWVPTAEQLDVLNKNAYDFSKELPDIIRTYVYINPLLPNAMERLEHGVEDYGMCGMKLWVSTLCDHESVNLFVERCIKYNIPILLHCAHKTVGAVPNETVSINVRNLSLRYPEAKIIMAHLGGDAYLAMRTIQDCRNVYTDISGSLFRGCEIDYTVDILGAERILFGTDMPYVPYSVNIGKVCNASLTSQQKDLILFKNAQRIFTK